MSVLAVDHLAKAFQGVVAVDDLSFAVERGEMVALIGPNGAGKSTSFNMLNGQLTPDRGSIRLFGKDITGWPARRIAREGVGRTFQITQTFGSMTVRENVQTALIAHRRRGFDLFSRAVAFDPAAADALLATVGLTEAADRPAAQLAYGDLKRLELAVALSGKPRLLLMDEPTAGMAPGERQALMSLVREIASAADGPSVLFTEHDMDVVFAHADRILVMNRGALIAEGGAEDIRNDPRVREVYLGGGAVPATERGADA
ncbi:MAG: ABC transporter ATP-binding protein [Aurantimonas endophytica]|uniref:ABC transporter ATP-binding protein n=1 Tax=Aurantimonas endophytica TaxID=1522175 RepID=UPI003002FFF9